MVVGKTGEDVDLFMELVNYETAYFSNSACL